MADITETSPTISELMSRYLQTVERARNRLTMLAYKNGLQVFCETLKKKSLDPDSTPIQKLTEAHFAKFIEHLSVYAPTTEQLYLQAVKGFYLFVDAEELIQVNQSRLKVLMKQRSRRPGTRIPQALSDDIEILLEKVRDVENLIFNHFGRYRLSCPRSLQPAAR
jgi:site-specific recombinase XerD